MFWLLLNGACTVWRPSIPSPVLTHPLLGSAWTSSCSWKVVNEFLFLLCLHIYLLLSLWSILPFLLFPHHPGGEGAKQTPCGGVWLFAGIHPAPPPKTEWAVYLRRKLAGRRTVGEVTWSNLKGIWNEWEEINPNFPHLPFTKHWVCILCLLGL